MGRDWVLSPEVALLAEGVDRNTIATSKTGCVQASPSSRRAWIEITVFSPLRIFSHVALLAEGVDRNFSGRFVSPERQVALLAEGVDRNFADPAIRAAYLVALLAEGVDRNSKRNCTSPERTQVALLAEGVDRN